MKKTIDLFNSWKEVIRYKADKYANTDILREGDVPRCPSLYAICREMDAFLAGLITSNSDTEIEKRGGEEMILDNIKSFVEGVLVVSICILVFTIFITLFALWLEVVLIPMLTWIMSINP